MSKENEGTLQKLKALARGDRPVRSDTLELSPEMIAAQETKDADHEIDDLEIHDEVETHTGTKVDDQEQVTAPPSLPAPPAPSLQREEPVQAEVVHQDVLPEQEQEDAAETEKADEEISLDRLMRGDLYPRLSMPLSMAADYDLMNAALRDGRLRIDAVGGQPTLVMTDQSIRSLVEDEKRAASEVISRIDKAGDEIAELEQRLASAKSAKTQDLETASKHSERIRQLQKHIEGK